MAKNLHKFFDPDTIPTDSKVRVDISYFRMIREKIKISFLLPNDPSGEFPWDYPMAEEILEEVLKAGIDYILVDKEIYQEKVKELAGL